MDEILNTFQTLKDKDVARLTQKLSQQQEQVIVAFGGITNMIELCLTNPNTHKYIDINSPQFTSFKQMLQIKNPSNTQTINVTWENKENSCSVEIHCQTKDDHNDHNPNINTNNTNLKFNTTCNNNDCQQNTSVTSDNRQKIQIQTVTTSSEFNNSIVIIDCDPTNNMLFTLIKNTNTATFIYNAILSKSSFIFLICLSVIFTLLLILSLYVYSSSNEMALVFDMAQVFVEITFVFFCTCLILMANKTVAYLVMKTFEFWFQVYNLAVFIVASWVRWYGLTSTSSQSNSDTNQYIVLTIFWQLISILLLMNIFLIDAIPLCVQLKRVTVITVAIFCSIEAQGIYFYSEDYQWNPFNFEYSQLSFKSIILSSYVNLIIFMTKRVFSDVIRYTGKICFNKNSNDHYHKGEQRCQTLYKRPHLKLYKLQSAIDVILKDENQK